MFFSVIFLAVFQRFLIDLGHFSRRYGLDGAGGGEGGILDIECLVLNLGGTSSVCLAGKIVSIKSVNIFALIDVMVKAFKSKGKVQAQDWRNGIIMFSFEKKEERDWVLRN